MNNSMFCSVKFASVNPSDVCLKFKWLILCGEHVGNCFLNVSIRIVVRDLNNLNNPVKHCHDKTCRQPFGGD